MFLWRILGNSFSVPKNTCDHNHATSQCAHDLVGQSFPNLPMEQIFCLRGGGGDEYDDDFYVSV